MVIYLQKIPAVWQLVKFGYIGKNISDAAAAYICQHGAELDGYVYEPLLEMAKILQANQRYLATSVIYRSLLSMLKRAQPKTYNHGVRHLTKLDALAAKIGDWQQLDDHQAFTAQLRAVPVSGGGSSGGLQLFAVWF